MTHAHIPPSPEEAPTHDSALLSPYEGDDELPARPRRRLLTPATVALMLVLFAACGFVGGVLVEKGQTSSSPTLASTATGSGRFGGAATGATGSGGAATGGGFASRLGSLFGGAGGATAPTIGTVTNINGAKLYVTTTAGTMVEVITTPESKVTKSESVGRSSVHPGDSVVISGLRASNGTVTASSVTDSGSASSGAGGGGFASLFGGRAASSGATSSSGGTASLFGG